MDRIVQVGHSAQELSTVKTSERINKIQGDVNTTNPAGEEVRLLNESEKEKVAKVVDGLNNFLSPAHTSLKFEYHEKLNEYYVTLVDDNTKEVIKEIPSKKMLDFYAEMKEYIGIMVDKKI